MSCDWLGIPPMNRSESVWIVWVAAALVSAEGCSSVKSRTWLPNFLTSTECHKPSKMSLLLLETIVILDSTVSSPAMVNPICAITLTIVCAHVSFYNFNCMRICCIIHNAIIICIAVFIDKLAIMLSKLIMHQVLYHDATHDLEQSIDTLVAACADTHSRYLSIH